MKVKIALVEINFLVKEKNLMKWLKFLFNLHF